MRNLILLFVVLSMSLGAKAQVVQIGTVKEYNEKAKKTPLAGVELNVRSAGSTVSDKQGNFQLNFLTLKPGEKVNVRKIEKLGYEVFNKEAIEQWNINPANPFVIVMCQAARFKKIRDNYERVSSESYAKQHKKDQEALAKLKEVGMIKEAEYQKRLGDLQEDYERQLDNLSNYVERFARIDLSELSQVEQEIIELVQKGKIEEAISKCEEQKNVEKYIAEVKKAKEIENASKLLEDKRTEVEQNCEHLLAFIKREIQILSLKGGQENLRKISDKYESILNQDKSNLEIALDYIVFLNDYNEYDKAIEVFQEVTPYLDNDLVFKEKILTNIGNSFQQLQRLKEAIDYYQQAILTVDSSDSLDEEQKRYRKETLLNNMGVAYLRMRDYNSASRYLEECLLLCNSNDDNNFSKINCVSNLATLYRDQAKYNQADDLLSEGFSCLERMDFIDDAQKNKVLYTQSVLTRQKGDVASYKGDFDIARLYYKNALNRIESLYEKDPQKYAVDFAIFNYNYGRSYFVENDSLLEAIPYYEKSIKIYESVLQKNFIQRIVDSYAQVIAHMGRIYSNNNDTTKCIQVCERIDQITKLCERFPFKGANLLEATAVIYSDIKREDKSIEYHEKALKAMEVMHSEYPKIYNGDLARIYTNLAMSYCKKGMLLDGKDFFDRSIAISQGMYIDNPAEKDGYIGALWRGFIWLVDTPEYETGLNYLRKMQELDPDNRKLFTFECIILAGHGRQDEAKKAFLKLLERFPDYPKDSVLYTELGPQ